MSMSRTTVTLASTAADLFFRRGDPVHIRVRDTTALHPSVPTNATGRVVAVLEDEWVEVHVLGVDCRHVYRPWELLPIGGGRS